MVGRRHRTTTVETSSYDGPALILAGVSKRYGQDAVAVDAVRQASLEVTCGELVVVQGASGSGKSTLLAIAGGLEQADSGRVLVAGVDLGALEVEDRYAHRRRHIGYVFQDYNLIPTLTAAENIALPGEIAGEPPTALRAAALQALELVGLVGLAARYPAELSGGQQQRVAIARALSGGRRLLLADEPTGALDSQTAAEVLDLMVERVSAGAAAVVVTHDPTVAARADRVLQMRDGRLESGS